VRLADKSSNWPPRQITASIFRHTPSTLPEALETIAELERELEFLKAHVEQIARNEML
jgi:hypothetical protein